MGPHTFVCKDSDDYKRTCLREKNGRTTCYDKSDGDKEFCRLNNGKMTCSDNDHEHYWKKPATKPPKKPSWKGRKVNCQIGNNKTMVCTDSDGYKRSCHFDTKGRSVCKDHSDGQEEFCRLRHGKMTCSDNDHEHWWLKPAPKNATWNSRAVTCKKGTKPHTLECHDSDGY